MPYKDVEARRAHEQAYRKKNWSKIKSWMDKYYQRNKDLVAEFKRRPCCDCGGWYEPCQMDFDHRPGTKKSFGISGRHTLKLSTLLPELRKCDVVCANCHRLRTYRRGQHTSRGARRYAGNQLSSGPKPDGQHALPDLDQPSGEPVRGCCEPGPAGVRPGVLRRHVVYRGLWAPYGQRRDERAAQAEGRHIRRDKGRGKIGADAAAPSVCNALAGPRLQPTGGDENGNGQRKEIAEGHRGFQETTREGTEL